MHSLTAELHMGAFHNLVNVTFFEALPDIPSSVSYFPSRSLNCISLYKCFVTSYGPSLLGPSFPVSSAQLASLLRPQLISKASLFCARSTFAFLSVGMSISAGITASVQYVNENEVSPLLDFIMAIGLWMFNRSKVLVDT
ncbi:hypothetical protein Tco_0635861 [Tanacetum coccineum]